MGTAKRTAPAATAEQTDWTEIILYGMIVAGLMVFGLVMVDEVMPRGGSLNTLTLNGAGAGLAGGGEMYAVEDAKVSSRQEEVKEAKDRQLMDQATNRLWTKSRGNPVKEAKDRQLMDQATNRLWTKSRGNPNAAAVSFVILHTAGEGSHGIADLAGSFANANVHKGEPFEMRNYNQIAKAKRPLMRAFYRTKLPAGTAVGARPIKDAIELVFPAGGGKRGLDHIMDGFGSFGAPQDGCEARGTLLYSAVGHARQVCGEQLEPIIAVRGDLMRWSISNYADIVKPFGPAHPQFAPDAVKDGVLGRIDITKLASIARKMVGRWRATVDVANTLSGCGKPPLILFYEEFADQPESVRSQIRAFLRRRSENASCDFAPLESYTTHVKKVHSHKISDFVENAAEVIHHFEVTAYPTFPQIFFREGN